MGRARRQTVRVQKRFAELTRAEAAGIVLTGFDGRTFTGVISGVSDPSDVHFDAFAEGRLVSSTRRDGLRLEPTGPSRWSFVFSLRRQLPAGTPDVSVKHEGTDRFVDVDPDLRGFVNNVNETAVPCGSLLAEPIFYLPVSHNRYWPRLDEALVRHVTGGATIETYYGVGYAVVLDVLGFGLITTRDTTVAEIGCGCGRIAHFVAPMLEPSAGGAYDGFDTWQAGIEWAAANISPLYPHARFHHLGTPGETGYDADRAYRLALPDDSQHVVLAVSLFTHLRRAAAEGYTREISRVLRPGGRAYVTFFASKGRFREIQPWAPCDEDEYGVYFAKPEFEDAFVDEARARAMFERDGLRVLGVKYGHWRGPKYGFRGHAGFQDVFVVKKPQPARGPGSVA